MAALLLLPALVGTAAAQPAPAPPVDVDGPEVDDADGPVRLVLSELDAVLGPGSRPETVAGPDGAPPPGGAQDAEAEDEQALELRALVEHTGEAAIGDLTLVVEVYPAESTRSGLRTALDRTDTLGGLDASHVHEEPVRDGDPLEPGDVAGVDITIPVDDISWAEGGGVHPVRVALVRGASVVDEVRTAAVWLAAAVDRPLLTAAVWPFDEEPWRDAGGTYPRGVDAELRPGGALDAQLRAVERHPDAGVLLAPPAHLLEDLRDRAGGYVRTERTDGGALETRRVSGDDVSAQRSSELLGRLRVALDDSRSGPLARPYADADLGALTADESARALAGELARAGRDRLESFGQRIPEQRSYLLPPGSGPAALDLVPADTVVVPYGAIEGPDPASDPTLPSPVRDVTSAGGRPVTLLVADPYVTDLLRAPIGRSPATAAHRVLVETAMIHFEAPGASQRALAVLPPEGWAPSPEVAQRLLRGLGDAPWLSLRDARDVAVSAQRGPATSLLGATDPTLSADDLARVTRVLGDLESVWQARIGTLAAAEVDETEDDGTIYARDPAALRDEVLRATSRWYPSGSTTRAALLADVATAVDRTLASVELVSGTSVTLTSDAGTIPVTLQRSEGGPLDVVVEVASQARLTWPEGSRSEVIRLEPGTTQTVSFATRALSTGEFSVTVRVTDPSGRLEFDRTNLSVRSTAVSGPALAIIGGLVVALLAAGLVRRRPARPLEVVR